MLLMLSLSAVCAQGQEIRPLIAGQAVERQIAGGEAHTYQINLVAGQFLHILLDQQSIDVALVLASPDSKQLVEVDLSGSGWLEALSAEAAASGDYRLTVPCERIGYARRVLSGAAGSQSGGDGAGPAAPERRTVQARRPPGGGAQSGLGRDVEAVAVAVLLGRVHHARRVAVSLRSRRQHKAWGGAKRNPRSKTNRESSACGAGDRFTGCVSSSQS